MKRVQSIDQYRGFAILSMVMANYLAGILWIPPWLKHAPDTGLTVIDLVAPFFIFAIGLTYGLSFKNRLSRFGFRPCIAHFLYRYLALIGIGAILSAGEIIFGFSKSTMGWGVLQAIGVAGILTLPVLRYSPKYRILVGIFILIFYQLMCELSWGAIVFSSPHGGLPGSLSWAAMLIIASALGDLFHSHNEKIRVLIMTFSATLFAGILLSFIVPISKNRVSASYVLVCLGISGMLFMVFHILNDKLHFHIPFLTSWGKNPIFLYILHLICLGFFALPTSPGWYENAPGWLVFIQIILLMVSISVVARYFERKEWVITL